MNKKFRLLLLSIALITATAVVAFAANKVIEFVARVEFKAPVLTHTPITNVSSISKELNAGVIVDFGMFSYADAKAELVYSLDNSANVTVPYNGTIENNKQFFISTGKFDEGYSNIKYQIKVSFEKLNKTVYSVYSPETSTDFHSATISNSTSTVVGSGGGQLEYDNGNQETGNDITIIPSGAFEEGTTVIITDLDFSGASPVSGLRSVSKAPAMSSDYGRFGKPIKGKELNVDPAEPIDQGIDMSDRSETKFTVVWRETDTSDISTWKVVGENIQKSSDGYLWFKMAKAGQYLVFPSSDLAAKTHRPVRRTIVKGRIGTKYPGFEFPNLKEGDVLKIYTVNGKKIREISSGSNNNLNDNFVWDGRKDSGDWAKSGIYVYQIKIKETGKLVSGTIVFVY